jgi:protein required for attachment to host cells
MTHEESRMKTSALASDRAGGRSAEGASVHHDALAPASDPKEVEKEAFAAALVDLLDQALRSQRFARWVLVAPPHLVGVIKGKLTKELAKHLGATVEKELADLDGHAVEERLRDAVRIPADERDVVRENRKHSH